MNYRAMVHYLGTVCKLEAAFLLAPALLSLWLGEYAVVRACVATAAVLLLLGMASGLVRARDNVYVRDSFVIVAVCWIALSLGGTFPYWLSGEIGSFVDCLFESVSGFTTTAATVVGDVEAMSRGLLLWRSLSLWIGGMGVLMLLLAVFPAISGFHQYHLLRAESPGPMPGKLAPKLRRSAGILYGIYLGLTLLEVLLLLAGGMPLFDSVVTSMATVGTGGFSVRNASVGGYGSLYTEAVVLGFMLLSGLNFNVHFAILTRNFRGALRNDEARAYLGILGAGAAAVSLNLILSGWAPPLESLRHGVFQVVSVATTTGFATADPGSWPNASKVILFLLMFVGACAGSSGGGLKVSRLVLLFREARRVLHRMLRPRSVGIVTLDGKRVDPGVLHGTGNYVILYLIICAASALILSLEGFGLETTLVAVASCINNVGAGLGMVSQAGDYASFSTLGKLVLAFDMLLGRLEIYPVLMLFYARTWRGFR